MTTLILADAGGMALATDLVIVMGVAAVVSWLFQAARLDAIPGYLIAGVLVGPHVLGLIPGGESIDQISSLAIILLMAGIGMHMDLAAIRRGLVHIMAVGIISTLGVLLVTWGLLALTALDVQSSLSVAMGVSMSSTAVFVRVVQQRRESRSLHARVGLGVAIVQDLFAVLYLAIVPVLARWKTGIAPESSGWFEDLPRWLEAGIRGLLGVGGVFLMVLLGKYLLPRAMRLVARSGSNELVLIVSGAVAFGAAVATTKLGFSPEMGAFIAGFLLAGTPYRFQLAGQLAPVRDVLMAVFFTAVGMRIVPSVVIENWWAVLLGVPALMGLKLIAISGSGWMQGMTAPGALLTGIYLANSGEFTLVLAAQAQQTGVIDDQTMGMLTGVVVVTLMISPMLVGPAHRWSERLAHVRMARSPRVTPLTQTAPDDADEPILAAPAHVIIAGFGPVGRALADHLLAKGVPFTVVELNPRTVERQSGLGRRVVYGDITNSEVLESAGIHHADAVVITIPDSEIMLRAVQAIRRLAPGIFVAVRTAYLSGKVQALQLGADHVTVEEIATAIAMEQEVMEALTRRSESVNPARGTA